MMKLINAMFMTFIAAILFVSLIVYAALMAAESRCGDLGKTYGKQTYLLANGSCYVLVNSNKERIIE